VFLDLWRRATEHKLQQNHEAGEGEGWISPLDSSPSFFTNQREGNKLLSSPSGDATIKGGDRSREAGLGKTGKIFSSLFVNFNEVELN
jgi:hypothetical protein